MKRFVSVWLPHWPTDRWRRQWRQRNSAAAVGARSAPLVLFAPIAGALSITAVDRAAAARGLRVGQRLADARAIVPGLLSAPADAMGDAADLDRLANWGTRYTPWAARDGEDGLILEITGCAHLFGGEAPLIADLQKRLARFGVTALAAAAATPAAAWAFARYDKTADEPQPPAIDPARDRARLAALPVEALRLSGESITQLHRFGLRRIGDLVAVPRGPLTARLGDEVVRRLDLISGAAQEPISPRRPVACWQTRLTFPDGIARREDIDRATRHLLDDLCNRLAEAGRGARGLELVCYRLDGALQTIEIGTGKPTHQAAHLFRLFEEKLATLEPDFGIETMLLNATATDPLALHQADLTVTQPGGHDLSNVIDRLRNRLGPKRVLRLAPRASHWPERAVVAAPALRPSAKTIPWRQAQPRPLHLLTPPEPLEISGDEARESATQPPAGFRWRRSDYRVMRAEGPERIEPEWWRGGREPARDYFWVQDGAGRRFWIYRSRGAQGQWYLHGLFA